MCNAVRKSRRPHSVVSDGLGISCLAMVALLAFGVIFAATITGATVVGRADNFTDIFYTNSFRGAFTWVQKLDWVGMIVQIVISTFSLFGVALLTIRIMTSMLFLSAKGMWEEVHDLKSGGGEADKDFIGLLGMAKSWSKGKAGTGLDAIIGAVLMILPDVKKYSDFGEKAGGDFSDEMSISQYMLKIALPTVMTVFFFAMGFNGTLFQALAVTVDAMGTVADRAVSVNYAGFVNDLLNKGTGYKFIFSSAGTETGKLQQQVANNIYTKVVREIDNPTAAQQYAIGQAVESWVNETVTPSNCANAPQISARIKEGLGGEAADKYMNFVTFDVQANGSSSANGALSSIALGDFITGAAGGEGGEAGQVIEAAGKRDIYLHLFIREKQSGTSNYLNTDGLMSADGGGTSGGGTTTGGGTTGGGDTVNNLG